MKILNLTQHKATPEQVDQGVIDLSDADRASLANALTFGELPDFDVLAARAASIALMAVGHSAGCKSAMIGGAPFFMAPLERALWKVGIRPLYAFSVRESVEEAQADGSVRKVAVFRHAGFVGLEFAEK